MTGIVERLDQLRSWQEMHRLYESAQVTAEAKSAISTLVEALEPFARVAELREGYQDKDDQIVCLKLTDCKRARNALSQVRGMAK